MGRVIKIHPYGEEKAIEVEVPEYASLTIWWRSEGRPDEMMPYRYTDEGEDRECPSR